MINLRLAVGQRERARARGSAPNRYMLRTQSDCGLTSVHNLCTRHMTNWPTRQQQRRRRRRRNAIAHTWCAPTGHVVTGVIYILHGDVVYECAHANERNDMPPPLPPLNAHVRTSLATHYAKSIKRCECDALTHCYIVFLCARDCISASERTTATGLITIIGRELVVQCVRACLRDARMFSFCCMSEGEWEWGGG